MDERSKSSKPSRAAKEQEGHIVIPAWIMRDPSDWRPGNLGQRSGSRPTVTYVPTRGARKMYRHMGQRVYACSSLPNGAIQDGACAA